MDRNLERALAARRESRRVEFRATFDVESPEDWFEIVRDIIALANSGGGVILFGVDQSGEPTGADLSAIASLSRAGIVNRVQQSIDSNFSELELVEAEKNSRGIVALIVGDAPTPIVFRESGTLYFRHGAKSEPATTQDIAAAIDRRVKAHHKSWLSAVKSVVQPRPTAATITLPTEVRDSDSPTATPIRVVDDPRAPAFRVVDYDKTHPYRQKEVLAAFHERMPDRKINQFDLQVVRHLYGIDANADFSHKTLFGTRQYSGKFLNWLVEQASREPNFFENARAEFARRRGRVSSA